MVRGLIVRGPIVVKSYNSLTMENYDVKLLFGNRVRRLRKSRGWSQEDFAYRVGLDRSYVGGIERGERNVSLENICLIARTLGVDPAELFQGWQLDDAIGPGS